MEIVVFDSTYVSPLIRVWEGRAALLEPLNYARFFLPDIFPSLQHSIVVYMDPDTVMANSQDIAELHSTLERHQQVLPCFIVVSKQCVS